MTLVSFLTNLGWVFSLVVLLLLVCHDLRLDLATLVLLLAMATCVGFLIHAELDAVPDMLPNGAEPAAATASAAGPPIPTSRIGPVMTDAARAPGNQP